MHITLRLRHLLTGAVLIGALATAPIAAGQEPLTGFDGEWQAIDYSSSADDPSWQDQPEVLQTAMGTRMTLGGEGFSLFETGCPDPIVLQETVTAAQVLNSMAGSTLSLVPYVTSAEDPVDILTVDCLDAGHWAIGILPDGVAFTAFFGGYLIFDEVPSTRVAVVQRRLGELGYQPGPVDGIYGARTARAALRFQEQVGLPPTGTITPLMLDVLTRAQ
jgi:hypothetical protein